MRTIEEVIAELRKDIHSDVYLGKKTINTYLDEILEIHKAERPQGKWVAVDSYSAFGGSEEIWLAHGNPIAMYYCSNCKNQAYANDMGEDILSKFCPNCGADMRGKEND